MPWSLVASSIIPIISAIPTGSFAPDSPFRIVPVRPRISRPPSTENVTAGSVGASAAPSIPLVIQERSKRTCAATAISAAEANVPRIPSERIGTAAAAEAAPADVEAALEEDHDQRDDADPLDGDEGDLVVDPRHEVGDHRRGDEEERRARDRQPFGDRTAVQRQRDPAGDDEHDQTEVWDLRHRVNLGVCEVTAAAYTFLT